jgi:diadenosine tetraphosphate (Ap4A) HIT family hydrolase
VEFSIIFTSVHQKISLYVTAFHNQRTLKSKANSSDVAHSHFHVFPAMKQTPGGRKFKGVGETEEL